jgi:hypothetical protein
MRQTLSLSSYANQQVWIRFKYKNFSRYDEGNGFILDEFRVEEVNNTCRPPSDLSASGIRQDTTVELAWARGTNEIHWELEYGNPLFRLGTGTRVTIQNGIPRYRLRGDLNKEFYVRGICGAGTYTQWVGPVKVLNKKPALYNIYGLALPDSLRSHYNIDMIFKGFGTNAPATIGGNTFSYGARNRVHKLAQTYTNLHL